MGLPFGPGGCPSSGKTKRKEVKELIEALGKKNRRVKGTSSGRSPISNWIICCGKSERVAIGEP